MENQSELIKVDDNIKRIREQIAEAALRSGRKSEDVRFMAVTKLQENYLVNRAIADGIDLIGENYVKEFLDKKDFLNLDGVEKHLIGHLQTNKVRKIITEVDMIESVDSMEVAEEIERQCEKHGVDMNVLIEVNIGGEQSKTGFDISEVEEKAAQISELGRVKIQGLMTIPPATDDKRELRRLFEEMRKLFVDIQDKKQDNINMNILSMGMSHDYTEAVECGSTEVRIGSAVFGARDYSKKH